MKKLLITSLILLFSIHVFSYKWNSIHSTTEKKPEINLVYSNIDQSKVSISIPGFYTEKIRTREVSGTMVKLDDASPILQKGAPDLPRLTTSLIIPDRANMEVKVLSSEYTDYQNINILPSKGNLTRDIDPSTIPYEFGEEYQQNEFYPGMLTELRTPHIIRDFRGQTIIVYPFQYNPVAKILRVYHHLEIELVKKDDIGENMLIRKNELEAVNNEFNKIYQRQFLNAGLTRYDPLDEEGCMLIISYGDFIPVVQELADWKIQTGIETEIVNVADVGLNSNDIKDYIADYYDNHDLAYVLLVGDASQVPPAYANGDSDNKYTYLAGMDHYPDIFIGRFSAETSDHVQVQVDRTLEYEKNPYMDTDWFSKGMGIASNQGPGDEGEYDYEHIRNIHDDLLGFTYASCSELFDGSQGGLDEPGNPTPTMVASDLETGVSIINYTGHGSTVSWGSSDFAISHVNQLTNTGMYPFIISVACVNGNFVGNTCFAEAWLRAEDNGQATGAVATLMSTVNQSWNPPMSGQDEMNDILVESYEDNIKRTFAGISMNGCMKMNDKYGFEGDEMTDTWTVFGDPSVIVRTAMPENLLASYNTPILLGSTQLSIYTDAEGARAALTKDGEIISVAYVQNGNALLEFDALNEVTTHTLTITGFNYLPHIAEIEVIPAEGPYVVYKDNTLNDENGNGQADYGETVLLSLELENVGIDNATDVAVIISSDDEYISINDDNEVYTSVPAGETAVVENGFEISISPDVPDKHVARISVLASADTKEEWNSSFNIVTHAPILTFVDYSIDDSEGNNNGRLDPGETINLNIGLENIGSSNAFDISGILDPEYPFILLENEMLEYGDINASSSSEKSYSVNCPDFVPEGMKMNFTFSYYSTENLVDEVLFTLPIGQPQLLVVDLTENPLSGTAMTDILTNEKLAVDFKQSISNNISEHYKVIFVNLGIFSSNHELTEVEGQQLADYLSSGGNLYMEGGDTWYYDDPTPVHDFFDILGTDDGYGDLGPIYGETGTFTENLYFAYNGGNNYVDRIIPEEEAFAIFENQSPVYINAIANIDTGYKTIGSSFEFGGLVDGNSTKRVLLLRYLDFFGFTLPQKASIPVGDTLVCAGEANTNYSVEALTDIDYYYWSIVPDNAGEVTGSEENIMIRWNPDFSGMAQLQVCGMNSLGMGQMSEPLEIEVLQSPQISLGNDTSMCINHSISLSPGNGFYSYEWMDGSTEPTFMVDSTLGGIGDLVVNVLVTDTNGCSAEASVTITIEECAGIDHSTIDNLVTIYPNPSDGVININISKSKIHIERILIMNAMGKMIYHTSKQMQKSDNFEIDLGSFGKGIYFVKLETNQGNINKKIIIQ